MLTDKPEIVDALTLFRNKAQATDPSSLFCIFLNNNLDTESITIGNRDELIAGLVAAMLEEPQLHYLFRDAVFSVESLQSELN